MRLWETDPLLFAKDACQEFRISQMRPSDPIDAPRRKEPGIEGVGDYALCDWNSLIVTTSQQMQRNVLFRSGLRRSPFPDCKPVPELS
jgi:hypothetical protein